MLLRIRGHCNGQQGSPETYFHCRWCAHSVKSLFDVFKNLPLISEGIINHQLLQRQALGWTAGFRITAGARDFSLLHIVQTTSRGSAVGIVTGYGAGRPRGRSSSPGRVKNFLYTSTPHTPSWRST
jgi:hypothetical protein